MGLEVALFQSFWFFLPAYIANPAAVLFGGGRPIDGGRVLADGYRLFGDGKTWRGLAGGILAGVAVGLAQWGTTTFEPDLSFGAFPGGLAPLVALPAGAMVGDVLGAYVKRRLGKPRGAPAPALDWYGFFLGAFAFLILADRAFFNAHYVRGDAILGLVFVTVITPVLHRVVNILGHKMGKKDVPW